MILGMACLCFFDRKSKKMEKKFLKLFGICLFAAIFLMGSCKDRPKQDSQKTAFESSLTNQDSVEVTRLVSGFFDEAKGGMADDAVAMLYKDSPDSVAEPRPLNNEEMQQMKHILEAIPIVNYHIDYVKFLESSDNEVKVTVDITEATSGKPALTTVFYFKPVKVINTWKLCVVDSHNGDFNIVKGTKRDSMQNRYNMEMREKNEAKHSHE